MIHRLTIAALTFAVLFALTNGALAQESSQDILETLVASEPADRTSIRAVQEALSELGYEPGPADGLLGGKTRNAILEWRGENDYQIAAGWLESPQPRAASSSGWRCTTVEEATSHEGPAAIEGGSMLRNMAVMMMADGPQYLDFAAESGSSEIPPPPTDCPDGAVYD